MAKFLSPNEAKRLIDELKVAKRKKRIIQVRQQAKEHASYIRQRTARAKAAELLKLAEKLYNQWLIEKEENVARLKKLYDNARLEVGKSHVNAAAYDLRTEQRYEALLHNCRQADVRFASALQKLRTERAEREAERIKPLLVKKASMEHEKKMAKIIANLPVPEKTAPALDKKPDPVCVTDARTMSSVAYRQPDEARTAVRAELDEDAPDAREAALTLADDMRDREQTMARQQATARRRYNVAINQEHLQTEYDELVHDLSAMQRADTDRRQRQLQHLPKQVFATAHQKATRLQEQQRGMEQAFENMFMAQTDYMGDLSLTIDPHDRPAPFDFGDDQRVPEDESADETIVGEANEVKDGVGDVAKEKIDDLSADDQTVPERKVLSDVTNGVDEKPRVGLDRLMGRIQKQRKSLGLPTEKPKIDDAVKDLGSSTSGKAPLAFTIPVSPGKKPKTKPPAKAPSPKKPASKREAPIAQRPPEVSWESELELPPELRSRPPAVKPDEEQPPPTEHKTQTDELSDATLSSGPISSPSDASDTSLRELLAETERQRVLIEKQQAILNERMRILDEQRQNLKHLRIPSPRNILSVFDGSVGSSSSTLDAGRPAAATGLPQPEVDLLLETSRLAEEKSGLENIIRRLGEITSAPEFSDSSSTISSTTRDDTTITDELSQDVSSSTLAPVKPVPSGDSGISTLPPASSETLQTERSRLRPSESRLSPLVEEDTTIQAVIEASDQADDDLGIDIEALREYQRELRQKYKSLGGTREALIVPSAEIVHKEEALLPTAVQEGVIDQQTPSPVIPEKPPSPTTTDAALDISRPEPGNESALSSASLVEFETIEKELLAGELSKLLEKRTDLDRKIYQLMNLSDRSNLEGDASRSSSVLGGEAKMSASKDNTLDASGFDQLRTDVSASSHTDLDATIGAESLTRMLQEAQADISTDNFHQMQVDESDSASIPTGRSSGLSLGTRIQDQSRMQAEDYFRTGTHTSSAALLLDEIRHELDVLKARSTSTRLMIDRPEWTKPDTSPSLDNRFGMAMSSTTASDVLGKVRADLDKYGITPLFSDAPLDSSLSRLIGDDPSAPSWAIPPTVTDWREVLARFQQRFPSRGPPPSRHVPLTQSYSRHELSTIPEAAESPSRLSPDKSAHYSPDQSTRSESTLNRTPVDNNLYPKSFLQTMSMFSGSVSLSPSEPRTPSAAESSLEPVSRRSPQRSLQPPPRTLQSPFRTSQSPPRTSDAQVSSPASLVSSEVAARQIADSARSATAAEIQALLRQSLTHAFSTSPKPAISQYIPDSPKPRLEGLSLSLAGAQMVEHSFSSLSSLSERADSSVSAHSSLSEKIRPLSSTSQHSSLSKEVLKKEAARNIVSTAIAKRILTSSGTPSSKTGRTVRSADSSLSASRSPRTPGEKLELNLKFQTAHMSLTPKEPSTSVRSFLDQYRISPEPSGLEEQSLPTPSASSTSQSSAETPSFGSVSNISPVRSVRSTTSQPKQQANRAGSRTFGASSTPLKPKQSAPSSLSDPNKPSPDRVLSAGSKHMTESEPLKEQSLPSQPGTQTLRTDSSSSSNSTSALLFGAISQSGSAVDKTSELFGRLSGASSKSPQPPKSSSSTSESSVLRRDVESTKGEVLHAIGKDIQASMKRFDDLVQETRDVQERIRLRRANASQSSSLNLTRDPLLDQSAQDTMAGTLVEQALESDNGSGEKSSSDNIADEPDLTFADSEVGASDHQAIDSGTDRGRNGDNSFDLDFSITSVLSRDDNVPDGAPSDEN